MQIRDILIYFSLKYKGDYKSIIDALKRKERVHEDEVMKEVSTLSCNTLTLLDASYPSFLKNIYHPPMVLFYYGDLSLLEWPLRLSVVGTREPSLYGKENTYNLLHDLLEKEDVCLVSGLAKGIDRIAHEVALELDRKTIAIIASGIDVCYPSEHLGLYEEIKEKGLILSEYPSSSPAKRENFASRNRLISAISGTLFVPEAKEHSGTSLTVQWAIEQNKNIICMPTHIDEDSLPNILIRDGAKMVLKAEDIFEELQI